MISLVETIIRAANTEFQASETTNVIAESIVEIEKILSRFQKIYLPPQANKLEEDIFLGADIPQLQMKTLILKNISKELTLFLKSTSEVTNDSSIKLLPWDREVETPQANTFFKYSDLSHVPTFQPLEENMWMVA